MSEPKRSRKDAPTGLRHRMTSLRQPTAVTTRQAASPERFSSSTHPPAEQPATESLPRKETPAHDCRKTQRSPVTVGMHPWLTRFVSSLSFGAIVSKMMPPVHHLPAHPVAILIGLAAGWQWCGMRRVLACTLDPLPATSTMLGAIALLAAALGPWLPERVVLSVDHVLKRRRRVGIESVTAETSTFWILRAIRQRDEALLWLTLSLMASVAAVLGLATLAASGPVAQLYCYLLDRFFWSNLTLTAMEWLGSALLLGPVWLVNGLVAAALVPVVRARNPERCRSPGVLAGVLIGVGLAWICHEYWSDRGLSGHQEALLGILPMFILAACAARLSQLADRKACSIQQLVTDAPEVSAGAEGLIWFSLVIWGIGSVLVSAGWLGCQSIIQSAQQCENHRLSWYLLVLGVGVAVASFHARHRRQSASGCGMALWAAGLGSGVAATLISFWPSAPASSILQLLAIAVPVGYALHYAERAWLARIGSEILGIAQLSSALLAGSAIGLIVGYWWALPRLGPMGMITAGSLLMLAFGGIMQIYEQNRPIRTQRQRLALIFASLAGAILLFPSDARRWAKWENQRSAITSFTVPQTALTDGVAETYRTCLIGVTPSQATSWLDPKKGYADVFPLANTLPQSSDNPVFNGRSRIRSTSAFRALRMSRQSYGLIYQWSSPPGNIDRAAQFSAEWFARLAKRTVTGGQVVIDLPLARTTKEALMVIAATFRHVMGPSAAWRVAEPLKNPLFRLKATPGSGGSVLIGSHNRWSPISQLLDGSSQILRPHSIQRDEISRRLKADSTSDTSSLLDWLNQRRSHEVGTNPL